MNIITIMLENLWISIQLALRPVQDHMKVIGVS